MSETAVHMNAVPAAADPIRTVPRIGIQAFTESPEVAEVLGLVFEDRHLSKAHCDTHMGGIAAAEEQFSSSATPNLMVVETHLGGEELVVALERLAQVCDPGSRVIVIGHVNDILLYQQLIKAGVDDYLVAPFEPERLVRSISALYGEQDAGPLGRLWVFVGAKGGVGSSTLAQNTAWLMSEYYKKDTILVDLDLAFGTADLSLNQVPMQTLAEVLQAHEHVDSNFLDRVITQCTDRLNLLAAPNALERVFDLPADVFEMTLEAARNGAPYVVIDLPHQWNGWTQQTLMMADKIVLTVNPDLISLRNAKILVDHISKIRPNDDVPLVVLNQVGHVNRMEISPGEFASALGIEPILIIKDDPKVFTTALNNGKMTYEISPNSASATQLVQLVALLLGQNLVEPKKSFLANLFENIPGLGKKG